MGLEPKAARGKLMSDLKPFRNIELLPWEVERLAAIYWPRDRVAEAVDVCWLESKFMTGARNVDGEDSRGLWQINVAPGANPDLARWDLFDAMVNAYFAHLLWIQRRWRPWYNSAVHLQLPLDW
jgi:hypothetical protein